MEEPSSEEAESADAHKGTGGGGGWSGGVGRFMRNRKRSRGERMTSKKYAAAALRYLR